MLDFTRALYLGQLHPSGSLPPWNALTTGRPAALDACPAAESVARSLAGLVGTESALLSASTFHLFWDLFDMLAGENFSLYIDTGAYPIARWGADRAASRGVPVREIPHFDPAAFRAALAENKKEGKTPLLLADGLCPACGRSAPLGEYLDAVSRRNGFVVMDDTQALGILGRQTAQGNGYGSGGGGSLRWNGIRDNNVILVSSLAKGFGVPVAVLCGSASAVRWFTASSKTRMHCSPPSMAVLRAAGSALDWNAVEGDVSRRQLFRLVGDFRELAAEGSLSCAGGIFPVQTPRLPAGVDPHRLHAYLLRNGVRTILHKSRRAGRPCVSFLITSTHRAAEIRQAVDILLAGVARQSRPGGNSDGRTRARFSLDISKEGPPSGRGFPPAWTDAGQVP